MVERFVIGMKFMQKLGKSIMLPVACMPLCGILMGIGYLLCLLDPENGALHDRICDTRVAYAPEKTAAPYTVQLLPLNPVEDPERDWYAPYRK